MSVLSDLQTAVFKPHRKIGNIEAQCTIEEEATDEVVVTRHPVEQGADISDHAYKQPAMITIRAGWSNSGPLSLLNNVADALSLDLLDYGGFNYAKTQYDKLLSLQATLIPFTVVTGKRIYKNCVLRTISQLTNERTEHALICTLRVEQIIITQTTFVTVPPAANMKTPQLNAATQNMGTQQPVPTTLKIDTDGVHVVSPSGSALSSLLGG